MFKFEWDKGNMKHVIDDYPERENSIEEIESIFLDRNFIILPNKIDEKTGEQRYAGIGIGNDKNEKFIIFVIREDKIRVISCRRANKNDRIKYYENIIKNL